MKLPEIKLEINGIKYDNSFQTDVRIDRTDLDNELCEQPEKYAFYAFLAAESEFLYEMRKQERDQLYARLDCEKRVNAAKAGLTKYTEKMCENECITDSRYVELSEKVLRAKLLADQLRVCANSFAQRREMLISLGRDHRTQLLPTRVVEETKTRVKEIMSSSVVAPAPAMPMAAVGESGHVHNDMTEPPKALRRAPIRPTP